MMKKIEVLFFLIMFLTIGMLGYAIHLMRNEGVACLQDPLVYGVQQIQKHTSDPLSCSCSFTMGQSQTLIITAQGKQILSPELPSNWEEFNFSGIRLGNISS